LVSELKYKYEFTMKETTQEILSSVEKLSNGFLNFRDDIERLIDLAVVQNKMSVLEELTFHAKFSDGMLHIIQKKNDVVDEQYFIKATEEYKSSIQKVKDLLKDLLDGSDKFIKSIFEEKFLQLTQQNFSNLNLLCSDLSYFKLYFNDIKNRQTKN